MAEPLAAPDDWATRYEELFDVRAYLLTRPTDYRVWTLADKAMMFAREAIDENARLRADSEATRQRVPSDEGGPGHEEQYWMRAKLRAAITQLRDIEDVYRVRGGLPESFNQLRADRARQLHEAISDDFLNGKTTRPTIRERAEAAEQENERLRADGQAKEEALRQCIQYGVDEDDRVWIAVHPRGAQAVADALGITEQSIRAEDALAAAAAAPKETR